MPQFSDDFIREQRELAGKAAPRPWKATGHNGGWPDVYTPKGWICRSNTLQSGMLRANAAYIAAAANNYPAALDEVERLRGLIEEALNIARGIRYGPDLAHGFFALEGAITQIGNTLSEVNHDESIHTSDGFSVDGISDRD